MMRQKKNLQIRTVFILSLVLTVFTGCEWLDSLPTMPFNTNLTNPKDKLYKDNTVPPGPVTNISLTPGAETMGITWTNPLDANLVKIELTWVPADGAQPVYVWGNPVETSCSLSGLTPNTYYTFTLVPWDTTQSGEAVLVSKSTLNGTVVQPPDPVTNLQAVPYATQIALTWTNPASFDHVHITWSPNDGDPQNLGLNTGQNSATVSNLNPLTSYTFTLTVLNSAGKASSPVQTMISTKAQTADVPISGGAVDRIFVDPNWSRFDLANENILWLAVEISTNGFYTLSWSDSLDGMGQDTVNVKITLMNDNYGVLWADRVDSAYSSPLSGSLSSGLYWIKVQTWDELNQTGSFQIRLY